ncbi:MAG: UDP-3-O-(3-hydroxymyristoyl)glucosamine N-acyltransferase [Myxococcota bacterium]|nr:UDP-3-O-(3-hydroxymyristoyl)glucosamine N-acyltransferase [Myxococcota bacterium]
MRLDELAERLEGQVVGDPGREIAGVRSLQEAGEEHLAFYGNRRYLEALKISAAGAVVVAREADLLGRDGIVMPKPYLGFARALAVFHPLLWPEPAVSEQAHVASDAVLEEGVCIEPFAVISSGATVGAGSWVQAGAVVGPGAKVGQACRLMPNTVVLGGCTLGNRVWLNPGAVIGGQGFGFVPTEEGWVKIPQVAGVALGDDVEVGANSCIDRGAVETTRVGAGTKLDNLVQIGHGAVVGEHSAMVAYSGVAGSTRMGSGVVLAARASVLGHLEIGDRVTVAAHSMVSKSAGVGEKLAGVPARDHRQWLKEEALVRTISELTERVRLLEARLKSES